MAEFTGGARLQARLAKLTEGVTNASTLKVGFLSGSTEANGVSIPMIAAVQNFGAPSRGIPPRPFFTNMVRAKSGGWGKRTAIALKTTGNDAGKALQLVGDGIKGQLQESIVEMNSPPNSPVTNLLKQRFPTGGQTFADVLKARRDVAGGASAPAGKPLVQSGTMLNSVGVEVT